MPLYFNQPLIEDISDLFDVEKTTVRQWFKKGDFPARRVIELLREKGIIDEDLRTDRKQSYTKP